MIGYLVEQNLGSHGIESVDASSDILHPLRVHIGVYVFFVRDIVKRM